MEDWRFDALMLLAALYSKEEYINVITDFTIERQKDGKEQANPKARGKVCYTMIGCARFARTAYHKVRLAHGFGPIR